MNFDLSLESIHDEAITQTPAPELFSATIILTIGSSCMRVHDNRIFVWCDLLKYTIWIQPKQTEAVPPSATLEPSGPGVLLWWSVWPRLWLCGSGDLHGAGGICGSCGSGGSCRLCGVWSAVFLDVGSHESAMRNWLTFPRMSGCVDSLYSAEFSWITWNWLNHSSDERIFPVFLSLSEFWLCCKLLKIL